MGSFFLFTFFSIILQEKKVDYDPMSTSAKVVIIDDSFKYQNDKSVPLRIYFPDGEFQCPVVLFSHGLGGSRESNQYLGNHWASRGYVVVFMQHAGSDDRIWKDVLTFREFKPFKSAIGKESFDRRKADAPATLDQLELWNQKGQKFAGRFNMGKVGMSGHSFGAITTQALCGQSFGRQGQAFTDARIKAAIPMSPSPPQDGDDKRAFARVQIPWMLMTGTNDSPIISPSDPEVRLKVFQHLPAKRHFYQLVLDGAEHSAFSEREFNVRNHSNPNHHRSILALSSAFWDTYLRKDKSAKKWLRGRDVRKVLEPKDSWRKK
jgi:predicted dienelactone hydrolase